MFTASSKDKIGKTIFYTFETAAAVVGVLTLILGIYAASKSSSGSFMVFVSYFITAIVDTLTLYGLGKIIDIMLSKKHKKCCHDDAEEAEVEIVDPE
jgi:membrane protein DedA with SNARE-associated domain